MKYLGKSGYNHANIEKVGVLITNLGTPEAATATALRKYLAEFLWDPRVVEFPRPLWWLVLNLVILRIRPSRSAATYAKIWTQEGSPLMAHTKSQLSALKEKFTENNLEFVEVDFAMRYGSPSIESALLKMQDKNVTQLLVLPLYPQYSGTTTASTFDAVAKTFSRLRWMPELRFVNQYHDDENYITACASQIKRYWTENQKSQVLLFSFHGLPKKYLLAGDPYHCQCYKTARLIAEKLQLNKDQWKLTFQSRFGREEWLQPYTDKTLQEMAKQNIKSVDVFCPGFSADCVETLEEIDILNRENFLEAGGEKFQYIPALNTNKDHIEAIFQIVMNNIQGWRALTPGFDVNHEQQEKIASQQRAKETGAEQ
tara:strand:- start:458 stop:1567 length:1110 start_codon:yes stop_codon:yes gene_type:complete